MEYLTPFMEGISQNCAAATKLRPCASYLFPGAVAFFHLAHFQECHQEGQSGFSPLIFIGSIRMQAVPTSAGSRIGKRDLQIVVSEEPIESRPRLFAPAPFPRRPIRLQACRNDCTRLDGLLVEAGLLRCLGIKALRTDGHEMTLHLAPL